MKYFFVVLLMLTTFIIKAQSYSMNKVQFMLSFEPGTNTYTAWVIPKYSTPNVYNTGEEEKGPTAQVTLKVPKGFEITNFNDIAGSWKQNVQKVQENEYYRQMGFSLDYDLLVIGKMPQETNYGKFTVDQPVALFSFQGKSANNQEVELLDNEDPIVEEAISKLSLNIGNSFYTRSGQEPKTFGIPLDQFNNNVSVKELVKSGDQSLVGEAVLNDETNGMVVFPNPAIDEINTKFFALKNSLGTKVELIDLNGRVIDSKKVDMNPGFNEFKFNTSRIPTGSYFITVHDTEGVHKRRFVKKQ